MSGQRMPGYALMDGVICALGASLAAGCISQDAPISRDWAGAMEVEINPISPPVIGYSISQAYQEGKSSPANAGDRIEVVMEGDAAVVNVYHERGIGAAEVRMPKGGWPAAFVVRLHGFPALESFKADAGTSSLNCELQRLEGRTPEQVCRMGNTRFEALERMPQFYQVTLPNSMFTPQVRSAELHWVDQWR